MQAASSSSHSKGCRSIFATHMGHVGSTGKKQNCVKLVK